MATENIENSDVLSYYDLNLDKIVENKINNKIKMYNRESDLLVYTTEESICDGAPVEEEHKIAGAKGRGTFLGFLKKGDKFQILKVVPNSDHVKIKLPNGKIGWIGGNHMVWD